MSKAEIIKETGIDFELSSKPFVPEAGVSVSAIGHIDPSEFLHQLPNELAKWGFNGEIEATTENVIHEYQPVRNGLDFSKLLSMRENKSQLPVTRLVGVHIPLFGRFLNDLKEG